MHRPASSPGGRRVPTRRILLSAAVIVVLAAVIVGAVIDATLYSKATATDAGGSIGHKQSADASAAGSSSRPVSSPTPTSSSSTSPSSRPSDGTAVPDGSSACVPAPGATMTNNVSHICGFADTTNAGVPAGTALTDVPSQESSGPGWSYSNQNGLVVTGSGTVISGIHIINAGIEIEASNVTIKNSVITQTGDWWGIGLYHSDNVTIQHCDISSPNATGVDRLQVAIKDVYGDATGSRILNNNIWHASTAIQISNGLIQGNYIHDFGFSNSGGDNDHLNGISVGGGDSGTLLVQDNTILNNYDQTDAVAFFQDFGDEQNKTVTHNLLAGGSYTVYGGGPNEACTSYNGTSGCYGPSGHIVITNNEFAPLYFPTGGTFGPLSAFNPSGPGNVWSGNVWIGSNTPVPA